MYFALGLLTAGLIALLVTPAIWRRAMRLTRARIEATVPMTRAEIAAEKDQLRARFAVSNQRLSIEIGQLNEKLAHQLVEVNAKRDEIAALAHDKTKLTGKIAELDGRVAELLGALSATEAKLGDAAADIEQRDQTITERTSELATAEAKHVAGQLASEEQRLELVERDTAIGNLNDRVQTLTAAQAAAAAERDRFAGELADARDRFAAELAEERERLTTESQRADGLEAGLEAMRAERAERLSELDRRAAELKALHAERVRLVAELAVAAGRREELEKVLAEAESTLGAAQAEITTLGAGTEGRADAGRDNLDKALAVTAAEKEALAQRLAALQEENAELRRVAGPEWESQRRENQALRDRLNEIAASVVKLTGAESPQDSGNGAKGEPADEKRTPESGASSEADQSQSTGESRSLADRLRALQHAGASR